MQTEKSNLESDIQEQVDEQIMLDFLFEGEGERLFFDDTMGEVANLSSFDEQEISSSQAEADEEYDETDFVCQPAFIAIKNAVEIFCDKSTEPQLRERAAEWLFVPNMEDADGLTFDLCCKALETRPNLIRLRVHYELYKEGLVLEAPLPFLAIGIPEFFTLEILGTFGDEAVEAADYIWGFPSLRADHLYTLMTESDKDRLWKTMCEMERKGYIAIKGGHWYFTGRNPDNMGSNACFQWTRIRGV